MNAPTTSKKVIKALFFLLLFYLVIREITPIDFCSYRTHSSWNTNSSNNSQGMRYDVRHESDILNVLNLDKYNNVYINFEGLQEEQTHTEKNSVTIFISKDTNLSWMRFVPLVKFVSFESYNSYSWNERIYKNGKVMNLNFSGSIDITGTTKFYGICSGKESAKFIDNIVTNQIKATIRDKISAKLESLDE